MKALFHSFKFKLVLLNALALSIALGGFGVALLGVTHSRISAAVDRDLLNEASHFPGGPHRVGPYRGRPFHGGPFPPGLLPGPRPAGFGASEPSPPPGGPSTPPPDQYGRPRRPHFRPRLSLLTLAQASGVDPSDLLRVSDFSHPHYLQLNEPSSRRDLLDRAIDPDGFQEALRGKVVFHFLSIDGVSARVVSVPRRQGPDVVGVVQAARDMTAYERLERDQTLALLTLLPLSLALAAGVAAFLAGRVLRPITQVTEAATRIGAEDLSGRLPINGKDELARLAATFNGMIARLQAAFERQKRFTADASHELRTPLTRIKVTTSAALAEEPDLEEYRQALVIADCAADSMERLVDGLLTLARLDAGKYLQQKRPVDLRQVAKEAVSAVEHATGRSIDLQVGSTPTLVLGDEDALVRVERNLLENAVRHTPEEGSIRVIVFSNAEAGGEAIMRVSDTGEGIPPKHLPHLGERFYRVDSARSRRGGGSGLGLALCREILENHHGRLLIESAPGAGTTATVVIPSLDAAARDPIHSLHNPAATLLLPATPAEEVR